MGWHIKLVIWVQLAYVSVCLTREMSVVREWTSLDVQLPPEDGQESRRSIVPSEIKSWLLYKDRLLVSVDRRPDLVYLNLTDNSPSPLLRPYPSWEDQEDQYNMYIGMSAFPRVDRCDRMWLLDNVYNQSHMLNNIIVLDLNTDKILRKHLFNWNMEANLDVAVDDVDCENEYIYIQSLDWESGWTYSWAEGDSWYHSWDNVTAMVLTPNGSDSIAYYNKRNLSEVFSISTTHLRNKTSDLTGLEWRRGLNVELATSVFDAKRDVLYYFNDSNKTVIHNVPCWTNEGCGLKAQSDIDVGFDPTHQLNEQHDEADLNS
ncbi:major royal jelly protein 1-like [Aricia agestis]|uniref:major royal jelly protein 1-like n=1 Tax=Aricia agestis TaxID=91739 RepID=UPI001C20BEE8|nr:major royal jelly protein 1-like [Aricia agestis]